MFVQNSETKFLFRRGECKTREIPISGKKGKIVNSITKLLISVKKSVIYSLDLG